MIEVTVILHLLKLLQRFFLRFCIDFLIDVHRKDARSRNKICLSHGRFSSLSVVLYQQAFRAFFSSLSFCCSSKVFLHCCVLFTKAYQDWDDGRKVFEFEFWKGNTEYDIEIDAATGRVRDFDIDYHGYFDFDD